MTDLVAAFKGDLIGIMALLGLGVDPNCRSKDGERKLHRILNSYSHTHNIYISIDIHRYNYTNIITSYVHVDKHIFT